jgi:hypothetical protein
MVASFPVSREFAPNGLSRKVVILEVLQGKSDDVRKPFVGGMGLKSEAEG